MERDASKEEREAKRPCTVPPFIRYIQSAPLSAYTCVWFRVGDPRSQNPVSTVPVAINYINKTVYFCMLGSCIINQFSLYKKMVAYIVLSPEWFVAIIKTTVLTQFGILYGKFYYAKELCSGFRTYLKLELAEF